MSETEFINLVCCVFTRNKAGFIWFAVFAKAHWSAFLTIGPASSLVNRASFICNIILLDVLVGSQCWTTKAALVFLFTWNKNLRSQIDVWPSSLASNFNSIWQSWCWSMGPTWATILRQVLVSHVCQVVFSVNWTPIPTLWQIGFWNHLNVTISLEIPRVFKRRSLVASLFWRNFGTGKRKYQSWCKWTFHSEFF